MSLPPSPRRRFGWRPLAVLVLALVVAATGITVAVTRGGTENGQQPRAGQSHGASAGPTEPGPTEPEPSPGSGATTAPSGRAAYAPQPGRRFIWVGALAPQFTEAEYRQLARNYDVVVIAKFHAHFDIDQQAEAARRLVRLNPDIKVYAYFSAEYWFAKNQWGTRPDPAWFLRDRSGEVVTRDRHRGGRRVAKATYVDLADPAYRDWALGVIRSWMDEAPWAGVAFDAAVPLGQGDAVNQRHWDRLLGADRVAAYNDGLRQLLAGAQGAVGPDGQVLYNGISPNPHLKDADRNIDLLQVSDGALDERFCLDAQGRVAYLREDLAMLAEHGGGDELFMHANARRVPSQDRPRLERFCLGAFLLAWQPGVSYYQSGTDYTTRQLRDANPDAQLDLGAPTGPYEQDGDLASRDFAHGTVLVNLGTAPATYTLSERAAQATGGAVGAAMPAGERVEVPPTDTVFLLH